MTSLRPAMDGKGDSMLELKTWDWVLLAAASYIAVITLVRLMQRRRESIIRDLTREVELAKQRLKEEKTKDLQDRKLREQRKQRQRTP